MTTASRSEKRRKKTPGQTVRDSLKESGVQPASGKMSNVLKQPQNRWQRAARYTWDKNRGRG
jgi:hypothetical protein